MAFVPDTRLYGSAAGTNAAVIDAGLRAYMLRVYNWMASGLLLTGVVAYGVANTSLINLFYPLVETPYGLRHTQGPLAIVAMLAPLAFVLVLSFGVNRLSRRPCRASSGPSAPRWAPASPRSSSPTAASRSCAPSSSPPARSAR